MREIQLKKPIFPHNNSGNNRIPGGFTLLALAFIIGAAVGAFIGAFSSVGNIFSIRIDSSPAFSDYIKLLWENLRFQLAAVFLSTTFLGLLLLPILSAARGYFIGCTASAIFVSYPGSGILLSFTALGIPLLIALPCFFLLSTDSFDHSARILNSMRKIPLSANQRKLAKHIFACFFAVAFWTAVQLFISPRIIAALI